MFSYDEGRVLRAILDEAAQLTYSGEAVDELTHGLQAAYLARASGADDELILAAALHDVGRMPSVARRTRCRLHEYVGGAFVADAISTRAGRVVAAHVRAKRYLATVEPGYRKGLSPAALRSLERQGGLLDAAGVASFERLPWAADALALRRWDDAAKMPRAPQLGVEELLVVYARFASRPLTAPRSGGR